MPFDEEERDPHGECAAEIHRQKDEIDGLRKALLAACNYIEMATPNLGRAATHNYLHAAGIYRKIAAGEMKVSDIED